MKLTTKYVAFDVHQATTVASVRNDSGRVLAGSAHKLRRYQPTGETLQIFTSDALHTNTMTFL